MELNYYYRYLGDYAKDTTNLTLSQNGAYNFLLDRYYATEKGIPADEVYVICRAYTKEERRAVDKVLKEFFKLRSGTWTMPKCEKEISKARQRIKTSQENGAKGGRPANPEKTQQEPGGLSKGNLDESYLTSNPQSLNKKNPEGLKTLFQSLPDLSRLTPEQRARVAATKT